MEIRMKLDSIIFDLDGTLWDSTSSVIDSWNDTLNNYSEVKNKLSINDMKSIMGLVIEDVAAKLFPYLDSKLRLSIVKDCCIHECKHLKKMVLFYTINLKKH
jgi:phosphoglycolate phosphatase